MTVNPGASGKDRHDFRLGDEGTSCGSERTKFCHRHTITRDDKTLTRYDGINHFGVVISELALCNGLWHEPSVA